MSYNYGSYGYRVPGAPFPPGTSALPGMPPQQLPSAPQFQPPPQMSNINFSAPVIRLGVDQSSQPKQSPVDQAAGARDIDNGGRASVNSKLTNVETGRRDLETARQSVRDNMMASNPPSREEIQRSIFVGGLDDGYPNDNVMEDIFRCAGKLRKWTRAVDEKNKRFRYGFAEYEDAESLEAANELFGNREVEVPLFKNGVPIKDDDGQVKTAKLQVVVAEQSKNYIREWTGKGSETEDARQFRIDGCKEELRQCLVKYERNGLENATSGVNGDTGGKSAGDIFMANAIGEQKLDEKTEVVNIAVQLEDELSDIPEDHRATIAEEIRRFRDRSKQQDLDRLRQEEELEAQERQRSLTASRLNRVASPGVNGAPTAPRAATAGNSVPGAPAGPKGFRSAQVTSDYANGVAFVSGSVNGTDIDEDDDPDASDEELERRRQARRKEEAERSFQKAERRLLIRQRNRRLARQREDAREEQDRQQLERDKVSMARKLREWDDEEEEKRGVEEYYRDRPAWVRKRAAFREKEAKEDERDRLQEMRELAAERSNVKGMADEFMDKMGAEMAKKANESTSATAAGFKLSLGSAVARNRAAAEERKAGAGAKRAMESVENLLEDEEDAAQNGQKRRKLNPLTDLSTVPMWPEDLPDDERAQLRADLAKEVPMETGPLFAFPVKWSYLTGEIIEEQVRPFVKRKVFEFLGVYEDELVNEIVDALKNHKPAQEMVERLAEALDDEANDLVKKVWRLVVFWTESESRGIGLG